MNLSRTAAVGVVIPVHNEEAQLGEALDALGDALEYVAHWKLELGVVIVLDSCSDASERITGDWIARLQRIAPSVEAASLVCDQTNVGAARGFGCAKLSDIWQYFDSAEIWIATSDGDSRVPRHWLATQILGHENGVDLWTGRVWVDDWSSYRKGTGEEWSIQYGAEEHPIHGASMGFNAATYFAVGGFPPIRTGEDRELCRLFVEYGARWLSDTNSKVLTSARRQARAPHGFSKALELVDTGLLIGNPR